MKLQDLYEAKASRKEIENAVNLLLNFAVKHGFEFYDFIENPDDAQDPDLENTLFVMPMDSHPSNMHVAPILTWSMSYRSKFVRYINAESGKEFEVPLNKIGSIVPEEDFK